MARFRAPAQAAVADETVAISRVELLALRDRLFARFEGEDRMTERHLSEVVARSRAATFARVKSRARKMPAIGALPPETLVRIFEALDARSLGRAAQACRLWRALVYPIARPPRFRDPGFARIASSDFVSSPLVRYRDLFVGHGGTSRSTGRPTEATIKVWDARGNPVTRADARNYPAIPRACSFVCGGRIALVIRGREDQTGGIFFEKEAEPFDLALRIELGAGAIRVLTPEREVLFETRGRAFAVVGDVIAIASEGRTTFWSCPK